MKMMGTRPDDKYPRRSSRFRITTSPAISAQGKAGRSNDSTAVRRAESALSCAEQHLGQKAKQIPLPLLGFI